MVLNFPCSPVNTRQVWLQHCLSSIALATTATNHLVRYSLHLSGLATITLPASAVIAYCWQTMEIGLYGIDAWRKVTFDDTVQILGRGLYIGFLVQGSFKGIDAVAVYGCVITCSLRTKLRSVQYGVMPKLISFREELLYLYVL